MAQEARIGPPRLVENNSSAAVFLSSTGPQKFVVFGFFCNLNFQLPTKTGRPGTPNEQKRPAKMGREALHFVDEAVLLHFAFQACLF